MTLSLETKRAARSQLIDPDEETHPSEVITPAEVTFIIATEDLSEHEDVDSSETVLLCTEKSQHMKIEATFPADEALSTKIAERLEYSKYIISPTCKSYSKMYDTTTLALIAVHCFMKATKNAKCSNMANK